jgi:hypothetical protein
MQDLAINIKRSSMGSSNGATMVRLPQTSIRSSTKLLSRRLITQFFPSLARFWLIKMLNASPPNSKLPPSKWTRLINNSHRLKSGQCLYIIQMRFRLSNSLYGSNKIHRLLVIPHNLKEIGKNSNKLPIICSRARAKCILSSIMRHCLSKSLHTSNKSHRLKNRKIL